MTLDPRTFVGHCLAGTARADEIDDWVDRWHENPTSASLPAFLGMTEEEYANWALAPDTLPHIIEIRRQVEAARLKMAEIAMQAGSRRH